MNFIQVVPEEKSTSKKLATDAMFKLEHGEKDALKSKNAAPIIDRLQDHRERWRDDYTTNRILRDQFRVSSNIYLNFYGFPSRKIHQITSVRTILNTPAYKFYFYFQTAKKELKARAAVDAALLAKSSLDIKLLPQSEDDQKIASLLRLNPTQSKFV
jgi:coiled-coil domain-containing protein 130